MSWTLINQDAPAKFTAQTFSYTLPSGSPTAGQLDVIGVVMFQGTITTSPPTGWTIGPTTTSSGGGPTAYYLYYRIAAGGESSSVSLNNNMNAGLFGTAMLIWQRWSSTGTISADKSGSASNSVNTSTTPAVTTGTLTATGELSIAYAAMANVPVLSGLTWTPASYTALINNSDPGGGVANAAAYNTNAGTAAQTPNLAWTSGASQNQAILVQTFQSIAPAVPVPAVGGGKSMLGRSMRWADL